MLKPCTTSILKLGVQLSSDMNIMYLYQFSRHYGLHEFLLAVAAKLYAGGVEESEPLDINFYSLSMA